MTKKKYHKIASYSQYSSHHSCGHKYMLDYVKKINPYQSNIHSIFGTAIHESIQDFLEIYYGESKKMAMTIDLDEQLLSNMRTIYEKEAEKSPEPPCTKEELGEFYNQGKKILHYFKTKISKFFPKSGYELIGIEIELRKEVRPGVDFVGYIDVVVMDKVTGKHIIIDLKTATKGWSKWQKADKVKTAQLMLYKKLYSEEYDIPYSDISVEYHIMKRTLPPSDYPVPYITKFVPPNGKPSVNLAWLSYMGFVNDVFSGPNGSRKESGYIPKPSPLCNWCSYKNTEHCSHWQ